MDEEINVPDDSKWLDITTNNSDACYKCRDAARKNYDRCRQTYSHEYCQVGYDADMHRCKTGPCF